jgi:opacity protein-like surface antigen
MHRVTRRRLRQTATTLLALGGLLACVAPASAQGLGVGGRIAWVTNDVEADVDAVRMFGGQARFMSSRFGLEVALDRHAETFDLLNEKVTETPIQASLLMRLGGGRVAPYLLGGPGWYRREVESLTDTEQRVKTTEFGWHAGIGLEILAGRRLGIHGDYRYTFLDFKDDDEEDEDEGLVGGLLPGHRGSMWTLGATIYF